MEETYIEGVIQNRKLYDETGTVLLDTTYDIVAS